MSRGHYRGGVRGGSGGRGSAGTLESFVPRSTASAPTALRTATACVWVVRARTTPRRIASPQVTESRPEPERFDPGDERILSCGAVRKGVLHGHSNEMSTSPTTRPPEAMTELAV